MKIDIKIGLYCLIMMIMMSMACATAITNDTNVILVDDTGRVITLDNTDVNNRSITLTWTTIDDLCTHNFFYMSDVDNSHKVPSTDYSCTDGVATIVLNNTLPGTTNWVSQDLWINEDDTYAYQDNGYYVKAVGNENHCSGLGDWYNDSELMRLDSSSFYDRDITIQKNQGYYTTWLLNNSIFKNDCIKTWCAGGNTTHRTLEFTLQYCIDDITNGIVITKTAKVNESAEYNNYRFRSESMGSSQNRSNLCYIATQGWYNGTNRNKKFPFDNIIWPAVIYANVTRGYYYTWGTNSTTAIMYCGNAEGIRLREYNANATEMYVRNLSMTHYIYWSDFNIETNIMNSLNKIDFEQYLRWISKDFYQKNYTYTDTMTTFSHWENDNEYIEEVRQDIDYAPNIGKYPCDFCEEEYKYVNDAPESWDWQIASIGDYNYYAPLWSNWYSNNGGDESILIRDVTNSKLNSSTYHTIKVNLGHQNASDWWFNYYIERTDYPFIKNVSVDFASNGSIFGYDLDSYVGNKSLLYGASYNYSYKVAYGDDIGINPGDKLSCDCQVKPLQITSKSSGICYYIMYNSTTDSWEYQNKSSAGTTNKDVWVKHNNTFTIPITADDWTSARVLYIGGTDNNTILVDDCHLTKNNQNYGTNLGFEETYHSHSDYTNFVMLDNFMDTLEDHAHASQDSTITRPYDGMLKLLDEFYTKQYSIWVNLWNQEIHPFKTASFTHAESLVKQYQKSFDEDRSTSIERYLNTREVFRHQDYINNYPVIELFDEVFDTDDVTTDNYDRTLGILHGLGKLHGATVTYDWKDTWTTDYNSNSSYIFVRAHKMDEYLPRIRSNCLWINDSNGTIPFGHKVQVNVTYTPCFVNTTGTAWRLDGGVIQGVVGNNLTITGVDAESMHWLEVWSEPLRMLSHEGLFFLLAEQSGSDYTFDVVSSNWYPYDDSINNVGTFTYSGDYDIYDENTGVKLGSDGSFSVQFTSDNKQLNLTTRVATGAATLRAGESGDNIGIEVFGAFELVALTLILMVGGAVVALLLGKGDVDLAGLIVVIIVVVVLIFIGSALVSQVQNALF